MPRALARWVSIVGHPFVTAEVMVAGVALRLSAPREVLRTLLIVAAVTLLPLAVLMVRQVRSGAWGNVDASNRAERPLLFAVGIVALVVLLGAVIVLEPGSFLVRGALGVMILLAVCSVATKWLKVSLHMAFAALAATVLLLVGSPSGWVVLAAVPALAWSRLALQRHTAGEVVIGTLLGAACGYAVVSL